MGNPGRVGRIPRPRPRPGSTVYYIRQGTKDAKPFFGLYDLAARKETGLGSVDGFEISADGKKMIVSQDHKYGIIDLPKGPVTVNEALNLSTCDGDEPRPSSRVATNLQ